jgi:hypothetical protein
LPQKPAILAGFCIFAPETCYNQYMMKRKRRQDTKHAVYMLVNTNTNESYIGITVCGAQVNKALKVRFQKHVRRAVTENKAWALCNSIREHGAEAFVVLLVDIVRGRKPAHAAERELINTFNPALNSH